MTDIPTSLPQGWVEKYSEEHKRPYWRNHATGMKSWKRPSLEEVGTETQRITEHVEQTTPTLNEDSDDWEEKFSEKHGKSYFLNRKTRRKSWVAPSREERNNTHKEGPTATHISDTEESEGWEERYSEKHKKSYYLNTKTRRKSWVAPSKSSSIDTHADGINDEVTTESKEGRDYHTRKDINLDGDWLEKYSEKHGKPYYVNKQTRRKSWLAPVAEEVAVAKENESSQVEFDTLLPGSAAGHKFDNNIIVGFDGDISRIERVESPTNSPIKGQAEGHASELTIESIKQYTTAEVVATLNYYMKAHAILEQNLSVANEKCSLVVAQNEAHVADNSRLHEAVDEYVSQHHAREVMIQELQAQVSLIGHERDEALHALLEDQSRQADRDVRSLIEQESQSELTALSKSQGGKIASLQMELLSVMSEKEDLTEKNNSLNTLCDEDSRRISELENNLTALKKEESLQLEKLQELQSKCANYSKKCASAEKQLADTKAQQSGLVEKNKSLISENSKLIKKVGVLQRKAHKNDCTERKKTPSSPKKTRHTNRFSNEGIDIPVNMIQSSSSSCPYPSSSPSSPMAEHNLSDSIASDNHVQSEEPFRRREELAAGWVFVDVDSISLPCLMGS